MTTGKYVLTTRMIEHTRSTFILDTYDLLALCLVECPLYLALVILLISVSYVLSDNLPLRSSVSLLSRSSHFLTCLKKDVWMTAYVRIEMHVKYWG